MRMPVIDREALFKVPPAMVFEDSTEDLEEDAKPRSSPSTRLVCEWVSEDARLTALIRNAEDAGDLDEAKSLRAERIAAVHRLRERTAGIGTTERLL